MTKRASGKFARRAQDAYDTPESAVLPLLRHLPKKGTFWEPCAGSAELIRHIISYHDEWTAWASDVEPRADGVIGADALGDYLPQGDFDCIITNPPWTREILHPLIDRFRNLAPTWLLFDADWAHTKQAAPYLEFCHRIVSVGRVSWMGNGVSGFDNCAWYLFDKDPAETVFSGRVAA